MPLPRGTSGFWLCTTNTVSPTGTKTASLAAYDRSTGKRVWSAGKTEASYSSPLLTEFDGVKFSGSDPIRLTYGERVRIVLVNDTMMTHPIHLHGMWSDLEDADGRFKVRKHTIDMPPGARRSYRVTADALGRWAYHCHLLFHMDAGMMREVRVEEGRRS